MSHERYEELVAAHAVGVLDASEQRAFDAHLASCRACAADIAALREAAAGLALLAAPVAPSAGALPRLLAALDGEVHEPSPHLTMPAERRRRTALRLAMRALAAAVVAALCVSQMHLRARLDDARRELRRMREIGRFVTSPDVTVVPLWAASGSRGAHAKLAYDHVSGRFVLLSFHLPPPPDGERYQLWVISEGVRSAGVLAPDSTAGRIASPPSGDLPFLFAVSVEPSADVDEPAGPLLLVGGPLRLGVTAPGRTPHGRF